MTPEPVPGFRASRRRRNGAPGLIQSRQIHFRSPIPQAVGMTAGARPLRSNRPSAFPKQAQARPRRPGHFGGGNAAPPRFACRRRSRNASTEVEDLERRRNELQAPCESLELVCLFDHCSYSTLVPVVATCQLHFTFKYEYVCIYVFDVLRSWRERTPS